MLDFDLWDSNCTGDILKQEIRAPLSAAFATEWDLNLRFEQQQQQEQFDWQRETSFDRKCPAFLFTPPLTPASSWPCSFLFHPLSAHNAFFPQLFPKKECFGTGDFPDVQKHLLSVFMFSPMQQTRFCVFVLN